MDNTLDLEDAGTSRTYCKQTGCRKIYVAIVYKSDGEFKKVDYIKIYGEARSNDCGCSALESNADLISMLLKRMDVKKKSEVRLLVKALREQRCNKPSLSGRTLSCADAIGQVLQTEFCLTNDELRGR